MEEICIWQCVEQRSSNLSNSAAAARITRFVICKIDRTALLLLLLALVTKNWHSANGIRSLISDGREEKLACIFFSSSGLYRVLRNARIDSNFSKCNDRYYLFSKPCLKHNAQIIIRMWLIWRLNRNLVQCYAITESWCRRWSFEQIKHGKKYESIRANHVMHVHEYKKVAKILITV